MATLIKRLLSMTLGLGITVCTFAAPELTPQEQASVAKEDLASLQVLSEQCYQVIGENPQFNKNMHELIEHHQQLLSKHPDLAQDPEYQALLAENRENSQKMSTSELKMACEEVIQLTSF